MTHNTAKEDSLVLFLIEVTTEAEPLPHLGTRIVLVIGYIHYRHIFSISDTFIVTRYFTRFEYSIILRSKSYVKVVELW